MEELIHIPYGACIIAANGDIKNKIVFLNTDVHDSFSQFYRFFSDLTDMEVAYLYFLTVDANNLPTVQIGTICDIFVNNNKNKLLNSFYAQYGIYAYSISKNLPIYSCRIRHLTKNPEKAFSTLQNLYDNAVAPSHITEVLESMNEKTPA
ncbi:MAG: hypothetical protein IJZ94_04565 [Clostridia bacterium]|nr:hypothetical protein [Clostridia bacterium]